MTESAHEGNSPIQDKKKKNTRIDINQIDTAALDTIVAEPIKASALEKKSEITKRTFNPSAIKEKAPTNMQIAMN